MSAATRVELGIVIESRLGPPGADTVDRFLRDADIERLDRFPFPDTRVTSPTSPHILGTALRPR